MSLKFSEIEEYGFFEQVGVPELIEFYDEIVEYGEYKGVEEMRLTKEEKIVRKQFKELQKANPTLASVVGYAVLYRNNYIEAIAKVDPEWAWSLDNREFIQSLARSVQNYSVGYKFRSNSPIEGPKEPAKKT